MEVISWRYLMDRLASVPTDGSGVSSWRERDIRAGMFVAATAHTVVACAGNRRAQIGDLSVEMRNAR